MRQLFLLTISIILMAACAACTQNGGDIGPLFGSWVMTDMTADGERPADFDPDNNFWSFQSNIIRVVHTLPHHDYVDRMGSWTATDNGLTLNFTHSDDKTPAGTGVWAAPEWLGFPSSGTFTLTYLRRPSNSMELKWISDEGVTYIYTLRKTF